MAEESSSSAAAPNALADNIARKGATAYYYAHGSSTMMPGIKTTLGDVPRLLSSSSSSSSSSSPPAVRTVNITKFAWADDGATVKVYVDVAADVLASLSPESFHVSSESRSFELRIVVPGAGSGSGSGAGAVAGAGAAGGEVRVLKKANLHADISGASAKRGKTRVVVTLTKADSSLTWYDLQGNARPFEGDDD
jgi:hypothetical protein